MKNKYCLWCLLPATALLWLGTSAESAGKRQHRAHVHGEGKVNLVQEGQQLQLQVEIPGMDVVGFEHEARSAAQQQAVREAIVSLQQGAALFTFNPEAGCAFMSAAVQVAMPDIPAAQQAGHTHDKKTPHRNEAAENHTEFHATYAFTCTAPAALRQVMVGLFEKMPRASLLDARFATERQQGSQRLTRKNPVLRLE